MRNLQMKFEKAYQDIGPTAVYDLANTMPHKINWEWCKACEAETPTFKRRHECLCCGQETDPNKSFETEEMSNNTTKHTIRTLMISFLILISISSFSQSEARSHYTKQQTDSTTREKFKLTVDDDSVFLDLMKEYEQHCTGYNVRYKSDRLGRYKVYTVYFPVRLKNEIEEYTNYITPKK